ncbi:hypothetical protein [Candidatus Enterococcus clewellii]|uniref:Integral membrane protein n=1 Tax=Candidatus Enterococcus clewellii TaxID=1834193 RepID=A0A242K459_9ENTE|nr:hypothetical protein [Enterococcus sp. 9E7_DIV0242]OTP14310.1 hypothetical protein A5888_002411 [Enterococcus sp. 9E7_DIV0242]
MINQLKQSFFQVFTVTFVWVTFLLTVFFRDQLISISYLWHLIGISTSFGVMFGVVYSGLWNYLTLKPIWNVLISSGLNIAFGLLAVYLFSTEMFAVILPWLPGMLVLSVLLHSLAFYVYAKLEAKRSSKELNELIHNK